MAVTSCSQCPPSPEPPLHAPSMLYIISCIHFYATKKVTHVTRLGKTTSGTRFRGILVCIALTTNLKFTVKYIPLIQATPRDRSKCVNNYCYSYHNAVSPLFMLGLFLEAATIQISGLILKWSQRRGSGYGVHCCLTVTNLEPLPSGTVETRCIKTRCIKSWNQH